MTEYDTGVKEIDEQHRKLVDMLAEMQRAAVSSDASGEIGTRLMAFIKFTKMHLHDEESLMRRVAYSGYAEHKRLHEQLLVQFVSLLNRLKLGDDMSPSALVEFLRHWLIDHISEEDADIGRELRERMTATAVHAD